MKIVLASALFPPDIAEPAPYVKELSRQLGEKHDVTLVIYGYLPEKIPRVSFVCIDKRRPMLIRIMLYTFKLIKEAKKADVIFAQNGASIELPFAISSLFINKPFLLQISDSNAHDKAIKGRLLGWIERIARSQASQVLLSTIPPPKPEILPFKTVSQTELDAYDDSWETHLHLLEKTFTHAS